MTEYFPLDWGHLQPSNCRLWLPAIQWWFIWQPCSSGAWVMPSCHVLHTLPRGLFHQQFFHHNSNLMEILFHSNKIIAPKFCRWRDSCAIVTWTKICCSLIASNWNTVMRIFHRIWILSKKWSVKWVPAPTELWWRPLGGNNHNGFGQPRRTFNGHPMKLL